MLLLEEDIVLATDMWVFCVHAVWMLQFKQPSDLMESRFCFVHGSTHTLTVTLEQVAV